MQRDSYAKHAMPLLRNKCGLRNSTQNRQKGQMDLYPAWVFPRVFRKFGWTLMDFHDLQLALSNIFPDLNFETTVRTLKCHQNWISCKILCTPNLLLCPSYLIWSRKLGKMYYVRWNLILMPTLHFKVRRDRYKVRVARSGAVCCKLSNFPKKLQCSGEKS